MKLKFPLEIEGWVNGAGGRKLEDLMPRDAWNNECVTGR